MSLFDIRGCRLEGVIGGISTYLNVRLVSLILMKLAVRKVFSTTYGRTEAYMALYVKVFANLRFTAIVYVVSVLNRL